MTNYEQIKKLLYTFEDNHNRHVGIETKLSSVSEDKTESQNRDVRQLVYENTRQDMDIIDMDEIAHNVYRLVRFPDSKKEEESLASADAFVISSDNIWYFIEFKNGSIDKADLYRKIYDSVIMLLEMNIIPDIEFVRKNIEFILVYNSEKYGKIKPSPAREANFNYILRRAGQEEKLFQVEKLEQYLLKETHTYTKELFNEKFVKPIEIAENASESKR